MRTMIGLTVLALGVVAYAQADEHGTTPATEQLAKDHEEMRDRMATMQERFQEVAKEMADLAKGYVTHVEERPFLGVLIDKGDEEGIHVAGVSPDGGAEEAGLQADDIIVAINRETLVGHNQPVKVLHGVLDDVTPGEGVNLVVIRDGEEMPFEVTTTAYAANPGWQVSRAFRGAPVFLDEDGPLRHRFDFGRRSDLRLVDIGEDLGDYFGVDAGVLVLDTPAKSELKPGDIVKRIDGAAVSSAADAYRLLRRAEGETEAEVRRKNRKVTVELDASLLGRGDAWFWRLRGEEEDVEIEIEDDAN